MERQRFVHNLIDDLTEGHTIPASPSEVRINQIIDRARDAYYEISDTSHEFQYVVIPTAAFNTPLYKAKKQVAMPENLHAIQRIRTISGNYDLSIYNGKDTDFRQTNWNFHMAIGGDSSAMLTAVTYNFYSSFLSRFVVTDLIYDFNAASHLLTVKGADPKAPVLAECSFKLDETKLFDDIMFFKYCLGKCKLSFANIIDFSDTKLIGGYKINTNTIRQDGKDLVKEVEDYHREFQAVGGSVPFLFFDD